MKKIIILIISIVGGCIFLFSIPKILVKTIDVLFGGFSSEIQLDSNGNQIHQDGRKTIQSFGDRKQFSVEKGVWENESMWSLYDRDKNKDIDIDIDAYEDILPYIVKKDPNGGYKKIYLTEDELKPYIYTKGSKGYTRLNYETAEILQSYDINDFSQEDQEVFKRLNDGKGRWKIKE